MNIKLYIKSHIFNSSAAAAALAMDNKKHLAFAEKLIAKKINKVSNSPTSINIDKLNKYNKLLQKIDFIYDRPNTYFKYDSASSHIQDQIKSTSNVKGKWEDRLNELASTLNEKRIVPDSPEVAMMNDPAHITHMKDKTLDACNNVLSDKKINMPEVRRITTSLSYFSKLKDTSLASMAQSFLDKGVNNDDDKFRSYGSKMDYSDMSLLKVKEQVGQIKKWVSGVQV